MACPSFGSSSEVSLWYAADADIVINSLGAASQLSATATAWKPIPLTGESLAANLTSTVSEQITANRSYANSVLSGGEVSGTINFEAQANDFLYDMLICATQNAAKTSFESTGTAWAAAAAIKNASTKHCFAILRRVAVASGYDWYVYRGCQVGGMTLEIGTGALISGTINITGVRPDTVIESAATVSGWTYGSLVDTPLMSGPYSLREFSISTWNGSIWVPTSITMQSLSISIDNQMRAQNAVGINSIYAAAVASGRFKTTFSGSAYYANPKIYNALLGDTKIKIYGKLLDSSTDGIIFESHLCKVTSGASPAAGGPDQDLMISTEFQAFEDATSGTLKLTKVTTP